MFTGLLLISRKHNMTRWEGKKDLNQRLGNVACMIVALRMVRYNSKFCIDVEY